MKTKTKYFLVIHNSETLGTHAKFQATLVFQCNMITTALVMSMIKCKSAWNTFLNLVSNLKIVLPRRLLAMTITPLEKYMIVKYLWMRNLLIVNTFF